MTLSQSQKVLDAGKALRGKWKLDILYLLSEGSLRWSQLTQALPDAAPTVLTRQLRQLEQAGFVLRFVSSPKPPKVVEYRLTDRGLALVPFLTAMERWSAQDPEFAV